MTAAGISFVDVGQGDCTLVVGSDGTAVLVDCPEYRADLAFDEATHRGLAVLDTVFITHDDLDHIGGLYPLAQRLSPRHLIFNHTRVLPADVTERRKLRAVLRAIATLRQSGVQRHFGIRGDSGTAGEVSWRLLAPTHEQLDETLAASRPNHGSLVLRVNVGGVTVLLPGDADAASWSLMHEAGCDLEAEILLVPHHGAAMGQAGVVTGVGWILDRVCPRYCVLSVGEGNRHGHPHATTIDELDARRDRADVWRTQTDGRPGTVRMEVKGGSIQVWKP